MCVQNVVAVSVKREELHCPSLQDSSTSAMISQ